MRRFAGDMFAGIEMSPPDKRRVVQAFDVDDTLTKKPDGFDNTGMTKDQFFDAARGFLTDQEAYPENLFYRTPRYSGGMNVPGAPGNLGMSIATNYSNPALSYDERVQEALYQQLQNRPQAPGFDPENLYVQPKIQPGDPGWNPFLMDQLRRRFISDPRSGVA